MSLTEAEDYRQLIEQFLARKIMVSQFERTYLDQFKNEQRQFSEPVFSALDRLFGDIDMLCVDDDLRDDDDLDEDQLRESCKKTLLELAGMSD